MFHKRFFVFVYNVMKRFTVCNIDTESATKFYGEGRGWSLMTHDMFVKNQSETINCDN